MGECRRCGKCCWGGMDFFWRESRITDEEMAKLEKAVSKKNSSVCWALNMKNNKANCIVEEMFGKQAKPEVCENFKCKN